MKKIIIAGTFVFLLFEILFYQSNIAVHNMKERDDKIEVYHLTLENRQDEFRKEYPNIILEENDHSIIVLANSKDIQEIEKKYSITVEK